MAMVNVDFSSPSFVLGAVLVGIAVTLLQLRKMSTRLSQDADIVVAAVVSVVGATLIFQGWRLDPLLLLSQTLTTGVAVFYGAEAFMLRGKAATETPLQQQQQPGEGEVSAGRQAGGEGAGRVGCRLISCIVDSPPAACVVVFPATYSGGRRRWGTCSPRSSRRSASSSSSSPAMEGK